MSQDMNKKDKNLRMAKYDPENAYAWTVILSEVRNLKTKGLRQHEIARKMGVNRDTVSRWLSEERGGERTTFGAMLRYANALNIPYNKLIRAGTITPVDSQIKTTAFEKEIGATLESYATDADLTITDLAKKTTFTPSEINAVFSGAKPVPVAMLNEICEVIEVGATMVLKRATKSLKEKQKKNDTANAVQSA